MKIGAYEVNLIRGPNPDPEEHLMGLLDYEAGDGAPNLWVNTGIATPIMFLATVIHETMHVCELAYSVRMNHKDLDRVAVGLAEGLVSSGLVDPVAFRAKYESISQLLVARAPKPPQTPDAAPDSE